MTGKKTGITRAVLLFFVLLFAAQVCATTALAGDAQTPERLPGRWTEKNEEAEVALTFEKDGGMTYYCSLNSGESYTCEGTWAFEYVQDLNDKLTIQFTSTDNPAKFGNGNNVEYVYEVYTESWVENDTRTTFLCLTPVSGSGGSPFEDAFGDWEVTVYQEQKPNMKVVNCKDYVSLREKRSTSSKRLAKVPLGALVLAFPEAGEENGFIECTYHDEYGYILSEYLEPVE